MLASAKIKELKLAELGEACIGKEVHVPHLLMAADCKALPSGMLLRN